MTPSERDRVAAGAGLLSAARIAAGTLNLLLVVCLTRLMAPGDFAIVALVYMVVETVGAIGPLGLPSALSFFIPRHEGDVSRDLGLRTGRALLLLGLPWAGALALASGAIARALDMPAAASALAIAAVGVLAEFPGQALPEWMLARRSYVPAAWASLAYAATRFASLVLPAWHGLGVDAVIACFAAVSVLRGVSYFAWIAARAPRGRASEAGLSELLAYGAPLSFSAVVGKLNVQVDKYLVAAIASAEAFAVYTVGAVELPLVSALAYGVTGALVPTLVAAHRDGRPGEFVELWHGSMVKVAAIMAPVAACLFVLAEPAVRTLFSATYAEAAVPFRVYLGLLPLRLCTYGAVVRSLGATRPVLVAAVAALVANAALAYPLYRAFGLAGPALAAVLAQATAIAVLLSAITARLAVPWRRVFPYGPVAKALLVAAVAAAPIPAVVAPLAGDGVRLAVGAIVYAPLYLLLARATGVVTASDLRYVADFVTLRLARRAR